MIEDKLFIFELNDQLLKSPLDLQERTKLAVT